jgi:hypothetical protein
MAIETVGFSSGIMIISQIARSYVSDWMTGYAFANIHISGFRYATAMTVGTIAMPRLGMQLV